MAIEIDAGDNWKVEGKVVEGMGKHWEKEINTGLRWLKQIPVSAILLRWIEANEHTLWIVPHTGRKCNSQTQSHGGGKSWEAEDHAHPKGQPYYKGKRDDPMTFDRDERDEKVLGRKGTGKGGDTEILFSASDHTVVTCGEKTFGDKPDEALCHELVHALRRMQGLFDPEPTKNIGYMNEEEWLAVVVTNVFISAKGGVEFRGDYLNNDTKLKHPFNTSDGFLSDPWMNYENLRLAKKFLSRWPGMFVALSSVANAPFNPFRELVHNRKNYGP